MPTTDNIAQLVRAGRARWKIENEAFNTLKNQGYHLKHNFGHGDRHLSEAFFTLNLLAFFMHQIFELVDGLYQRVRTFFSSRRAFWDEVRSAFRLFLFNLGDAARGRPSTPATKVRAGWLPPPASPAGSRGISGDRHPWRRPWPHGWHATPRPRQEVVGSEPVGCSGGASGTRRIRSTSAGCVWAWTWPVSSQRRLAS